MDYWSQQKESRLEEMRKMARKAKLKTLYMGLGICLILWTLIALNFGSSNVEEVKQHAPEVWQQAGFEVIGYEGYTNAHCWFQYGCGHVWYTVKRTEAHGIIYHGYVEKWGDEYHIYSLEAIDAIKPQK